LSAHDANRTNRKDDEAVEQAVRLMMANPTLASLPGGVVPCAGVGHSQRSGLLMPEYLAPGVFVEETSFRSKSIEGVPTSTTAFVGFTRRGPLAAAHVPKLLSSFAEFERIYGGLEDLRFSPKTNHVAHAVKAFFDEGGRRLYVARVRSPSAKAGESIKDWQGALDRLAKLSEVAIVAAPGATERGRLAEPIQSRLVAHAEAAGAWRFAVLDVPRNKTPSEAVAYRQRFDSRNAAFYYPWIQVANPSVKPGDPPASQSLLLPPSGFICGIYARCDVERGVHKAPANEVVRSAMGFERPVTQGEQETLNPAGVNCLRFFVGRGNRVWGARTASSDPEWKYVNVRRHLTYLEHCIDRGTQWAVFEPNGERLWASVQSAISDFLYNEWKNGGLLGRKPEEAFFVRCDRTTMTQNDLDNGRLICVIGVAPVKPAEFVTFRIGQRTADAS
jgi:phage tail sheath protein FI